MTQILNKVRKHFNEPVIVHHKLGRVVGYAKSNEDEFMVIREIGGKTSHHPETNGIIFLDQLKGQNKTISKDGLIWDDYTRLDLLLESSSCHKEVVF